MCGQCRRYFKSSEDVNNHSHALDIAIQMRNDGEPEQDIIDYLQHCIANEALITE